MPFSHIGPDDIPVDDPSIPQDVCVWLVDYRKCADLKDQVDELSAELVDEPEDEKMKKGPDVGEHQLSLRKRKGTAHYGITYPTTP